MIRAFVAVELSPDLREALAQVQSRIRKVIQDRSPSDPRIQWVGPGSIHLTLKFLGEIEEAQVEDIRTALAPAIGSLPKFTVEVGGLGGFPDLRAPRVLWVGGTGPEGRIEPLAALAQTVEQALEPLGFALETKLFHPHLTLARIKDRNREVGRVLADPHVSGALGWTERLGSLAVERVSLMKSDLKPSGAVYTRLWEVPLG